MRDYQRALMLDTTYALAYFNAGNIYFHSRQFKQVQLLQFVGLVVCNVKFLIFFIIFYRH